MEEKWEKGLEDASLLSIEGLRNLLRQREEGSFTSIPNQQQQQQQQQQQSFTMLEAELYEEDKERDSSSAKKIELLGRKIRLLKDRMKPIESQTQSQGELYRSMQATIVQLSDQHKNDAKVIKGLREQMNSFRLQMENMLAANKQRHDEVSRLLSSSDLADDIGGSTAEVIRIMVDKRVKEELSKAMEELKKTNREEKIFFFKEWGAKSSQLERRVSSASSELVSAQMEEIKALRQELARMHSKLSSMEQERKFSVKEEAQREQRLLHASSASSDEMQSMASNLCIQVNTSLRQSEERINESLQDTLERVGRLEDGHEEVKEVVATLMSSLSQAVQRSIDAANRAEEGNEAVLRCAIEAAEETAQRETEAVLQNIGQSLKLLEAEQRQKTDELSANVQLHAQEAEKTQATFKRYKAMLDELAIAANDAPQTRSALMSLVEKVLTLDESVVSEWENGDARFQNIEDRIEMLSDKTQQLDEYLHAGVNAGANEYDDDEDWIAEQQRNEADLAAISQEHAHVSSRSANSFALPSDAGLNSFERAQRDVYQEAAVNLEQKKRIHRNRFLDILESGTEV